MITAKEASIITKANAQLKEVLTAIEKEIIATAEKGYGITTITFVKDEQIDLVHRILRDNGYIVRVSKVRNYKGTYNLTIAWE